MNDVDWFVGCTFEDLARREHDWAFRFDKGVCLAAGCLWRLIEDGRIRVTSTDHAERFGLPAAIDAAVMVTSRLRRSIVERVELRAGTLDLAINFQGGRRLELFPDSSGYESWDLTRPWERFVARGDGHLAIFRDDSSGVAAQSP
jgi:hypothetical protein